jgi:hypothetical protein
MVVLARRRGWKVRMADVRLANVEHLESRVVLSAFGGRLQEFLNCLLNRDECSPESSCETSESSESLPCGEEQSSASQSCLELPPVVESLIEKIEERVEEIVEEVRETICEIKSHFDFLPDCESEPTTFGSESEESSSQSCDGSSGLGDRLEGLLDRVADRICEIKSRLDLCDREPQTRIGQFLDDFFSRHDGFWCSCDEDGDEEEQFD